MWSPYFTRSVTNRRTLFEKTSPQPSPFFHGTGLRFDALLRLPYKGERKKECP